MRDIFFWSFIPLSALAIFWVSGGGKAAARNPKNELKQMLQSGLGGSRLFKHLKISIKSVMLKASRLKSFQTISNPILRCFQHNKLCGNGEKNTNQNLRTLSNQRIR
ncbi:hypothetical protein ATE47_08025 [Chryseobacterium sp. IHB B 17019]|nr:hypothetical protein ATE47_08025 [Chryseobacterium sp. IHB B 17019]